LPLELDAPVVSLLGAEPERKRGRGGEGERERERERGRELERRRRINYLLTNRITSHLHNSQQPVGVTTSFLSYTMVLATPVQCSPAIALVFHHPFEPSLQRQTITDICDEMNG
jgi:hypothetical protein